MAGKMQFCFQRYEKKYMLTLDQLARMLAGMEEHMKSDDFGRYTICNLYYDTGDFRLIRASLAKPVYKEKLRLRSYGVPGSEDQVFVELKKKFNGVVYKRRTAMKAAQAMADLSRGRLANREDQISREINFFLESCPTAPKVFIAYDRTAFAGVEDPELRITFDTNLRWRDRELDLRAGDWGEPILPPDQILMEVKIPGTTPVWLAHLLSRIGAFPTSFSKYGTCYTKKILGPSLAGRTGEEARVCA